MARSVMTHKSLGLKGRDTSRAFTMLSQILTALLAASTAIACADHNFHTRSQSKRSEATGAQWGYDASYNWGRLTTAYHLCQDGTQQSPIPLLVTQGLSLNHVPEFHYERNQSGRFHNWGYGPTMTFSHPEGDYTTLPSFTFDEADKNETVYMTGWHIHAPAEHTVQGDRSKAEMHFVHTDAKGSPRAVLAFRIDPGKGNSTFFGDLPELVSFREPEMESTAIINPATALAEVGWFEEFWTYQGQSRLLSSSP